MKIRKPFVTWDEFYGALGGGAGTPAAHTHVKADITDTPWAWADVSKVGSNLTDLATRQHAGLTNVTSDQHHAEDHAAEHEVGGGDLLDLADMVGTTVKLTDLTDGYVPYHVSDAAGLANSPILTDGTNVNIGRQFYTNNATLTLYKGAVATPGTHATSALNFYHLTAIGDIAQMTFGYNALGVTNASAYIGYVSVNQDAQGYGDLVFGTRSVNTDTQPTERMRITSGGNVGINIAIPTANLNVRTVGNVDDSNVILWERGDGLVQGVLGVLKDGDNNVYLGSITNHPLYLQTNDITKVTILADGDVGIGKVPTEKLDVDGDIRTTGSILGSTAADKLLLSGDTESAYAMSIIGATGYVGIRKLVPTVALDVNGTIKATEFYLNLGGLLDVNIATPLKYQSIYYIGGEWVNRPEITLDMPYMSYKMYTDFFDRGQNPPWTGYDVNNGSRTDTVGLAKHPGIIRIRSAAQANSGYRYTTGQSGGVFPILIAGEEMAEIVFKTKSPVSQRFMYYGYHNSNTPGVILNGVYLYINTLGRIYGRTTSQGVGDATTGTYHQLTTNTWYRARLEVNEDATRVDFWLYDEAGLQLWSANLVANIPTAGGKEVAHTLMAWYEPATAVDIYDIDFMAGVCFRPIARG